MAKVQVKFAHLHNPLFLNGKNFGEKLDPGKAQTLSMAYDEEAKELLVTWQNETAHLPSANVAYYIPGAPKERKPAHANHSMVAGIGSAQVETPMSHVHAGQGAGRTGKK